MGGSSGAGLSAQSWLGAGLLGAGNGLPGVAGLAAGEGRRRRRDGREVRCRSRDQRSEGFARRALQAGGSFKNSGAVRANSARNRARPGDVNGLKRPAEGEAGPAGEETVGTQEIPEMKKLRESGPDEQPAEDSILPLGQDV